MTAFLIILGVLALFLIYVATRPAGFTITRSTIIPATPDELFPYANDLHRFQDWSPWAKLDPNSKITFEGPENGVGSSLAWAGNNKVGQGKMSITYTQPPQLVTMKLEFLKPMKATNTANFSFTPDAQGTLVTWSMSGENGFMGKLFGVIVNCDKMVGGQFEQGLANLKALAGAKP